MPAPDLDPMELPERIGPYTLLRVIGRGGMGVVCLASKPGLVKNCALKVLAPEHSGNPQYRRRFLREGEILAKLRHSRIVSVLGVGEADGYLFIAMDYIDGVSLRTLCQRLAAKGRRLPITVVGYIIGEIFEALRHAHTRKIDGVLHGVIHRDVTPDNVMISSEGEVFLSDFGIARFGADGSAEMFGKLQYMAPEQGSGVATYRSDIWMACGVLHYMLTGEPPRHALSWPEFQANTHPQVPPTNRSDVPEPLERFRTAGLEPDPEKRLASALGGLLLLESWLGYRKTTTMLAEIYTSEIGQQHSGMSGMVPAAEAESLRPSAPPKEGRGQRANPPSMVVVELEPHAPDEDTAEDDGKPTTWRRRWWRGGDDEDDEDDVEEQLTKQFVEADAPRMFRRKRVVPASDPPPKLDVTVELPGMTGPPGDVLQQTTAPLDPGSFLGAAGHRAETRTAPVSPPTTPTLARKVDRRPVRPPVEPSRRAVGLVVGGFVIVGLALFAGLVGTCGGLGGTDRAYEPAAEAP